MFLWILFEISVFLIYFGLILFLLQGLHQLKPVNNSLTPAVTIVLAAHNEEEHLADCLKCLVRQKYPVERLQIILVNDRSIDRTASICAEFASQYTNIDVVTIEATPKAWSPKKYALARGIDLAQGKMLLFTDADCRPGPNWVTEMVKCFDDGIELVAGFSPLISHRQTVWDGIQTLDSLANAAVAAGGMGWNIPITCTGRNLAYVRRSYTAVGGFARIAQHLSGDDDLFMHLQKRERKCKMTFCTSQESIVPAYRIIGAKRFYNQRRRHISASANYPFSTKAGYFIYHFSNLLLWLFVIFHCLWGKNCLVPGGILVAKFGVDFLLLNKFAKMMAYTPVLKWFFNWELYFILVNSIIGPISFWGKLRWN